MTEPARLNPDPTRHLAIALDTSDRDTYSAWCELFGPRVGVLKVGLEAYSRWGPECVALARRHARRVFLDLKLHDIPSTVAAAVAGVRRQGVDYLTVHAAGGPAMLEAAATAAGDELRLLGVTLLTHLDAPDLLSLRLPGPAEDRVVGWAELAASHGCAGAVCSAREVALVRKRIARPFFLVTPGIRPAGATADDDQRRVATPARALSDGSDLVVIGRPLTRAADPEAALQAVLDELEAGAAVAPAG